MLRSSLVSFFFFFNDTATTEIYTLSLHDAFRSRRHRLQGDPGQGCDHVQPGVFPGSEEHTSELQSPPDLVCRLLLEKKKTADGRGLQAEKPLRVRGLNGALYEH